MIICFLVIIREGMKTKIFSNNVYALKMTWGFSKRLVVHTAMTKFLGYFEWLFYSAFFMRYVINAMEYGASYMKLMGFLGVSVLVFGLISLYNSFVSDKFLPVARVELSDRISRMLFKKARNVDLTCFEDNEFYNRYTLAMETADSRIEEALNGIWGVVFGAIATIVAFLVMYDIDHIVVLFVLFPLVGNFIFGKFVGNIVYSRNRESAQYNRRIEYINRVMYMREYAKEIRLSNVFKLIGKQYEEAVKGLEKVVFKYGVKGMVFHWLKSVFTFCVMFEGVLLYGAYRNIVSGSMSFAVLSVLTSMMVASTWILIGFADSVNSVVNNGLFIENLKSFIEYVPAISEDYDGEKPSEIIESIEFRNVSFLYKDNEVLKKLSFKLEGGKTYALVGHNGAGKSTIIKLLMRYYDPSEGEILLNGKNIKEYNLQKYRALFATAFQEQKIFSMSVYDNVLMGISEEMAENTVVKALKMSGVYEKVQLLPKGIDTLLTKEFDDAGVQLSGGEFQKIIVARAFVRNSPIKVFDEPSSALDPISENNLFHNILKNGASKTMLFISHRLSSVQNADTILMLENGELKEIGSHSELMKCNGIYADMYNKQAKNYLMVSDNA